MNLDVQKIINLHKIDLRILEIEENKGNLPNLIKEQEDKVQTLDDLIDQSTKKIEVIDKKINECNSKSSDLLSKIENYNKQIYSVKNNKEYEALLKEIDYLKNENTEATNSISDGKEEKDLLHESLEDSKNKIKELSEKLGKSREELKETSALTEKEESELDQSKNQLLKEIKDRKFVKSYQDGNYEDKITSISRNSCDNCYSSLPPQFILNAKKMDKLYDCPSCGSLLFWKE